MWSQYENGETVLINYNMIEQVNTDSETPIDM